MKFNSSLALWAHQFIISSFIAFLCVGCTSVKQMTLLNDVTQESIQPIYPDFVIGVGDELQLVVNAFNEMAAAPFNVRNTLYKVGVDGSIELPILGKVNVMGKTINQVQKTIASLLEDKLQNAYVTITIPSASVVLLGEVNAPQKLAITKPLTIFEAIGAAQGLTANAKITQIEVIRVEGENVNKYQVDLSSKSLFQSPCFYLTKGDVVNVLPLHAVRASKMRVPMSQSNTTIFK